jgi:G:T-mismatch repair DNA endonuclease (very short patch repair protein)
LYYQNIEPPFLFTDAFGMVTLIVKILHRQKPELNIAKDKLSIEQLKALGWRIKTIWECELGTIKKEKTIKTLVDELNNQYE